MESPRKCLGRLLAIVAACWLFALGGGIAHAQNRAVATLLATRGAVSIVRGGGPLAASRSGQQLQAGDVVRTGPNGSARLVTIDGKRATLGPNAEVEIAVRGARINAGRVAIWITGNGRTEIATPAAVAAADGTGFLVDVAPDGTTTLTVAEGTVEFYNERGREAVAAKQQSVAHPGQAPTRPVAVDPSGVLLFEATIDALPLSLRTPRLGLPENRLRELLPARREAARSAPADADAQLGLADVALDLGELEEAAAAYGRASTLRLGGTAPLLGLASVQLAQRRVDLVAQTVSQLRALDPNGSDAALAGGLLELAHGKPALARGLFTRAIELRPEDPVARILLGRSLFLLGDLPAAHAALEAALRQRPGDPAALAYLAVTRVAEGKVEAALPPARQAVALAPQSAVTHEALGAVLLFSGQSTEAVAELRRALEVDPASPSAHLQLARALAASSDVEGALQEAAVSVAADPADPAARMVAGTLFLARRDVGRAEREFRYALALSPALPAARSGLAAAALERGAFTRALREQKVGLALDPGSAQAHNNLGAVYLAEGRLDAAVEELQDAVRLQPALALAHANLALAYLERNEYARALAAGLEAVRLGERSALIRTTLARVYFRQQRPDRALAELRLAEQTDPFYPLQYFYLSQIYRVQGRERDSLRALFQALRLDPSAMVEQRLYSRVDGLAAGGENSLARGELKADGRALDGRLSYYASGMRSQEAVRPERGLIRDTFAEGIVGVESSPRNNLVAYGSFLDERAERPGADLPAGGIQEPNFRTTYSGSDVQLLDRLALSGTSWLTLKTGFRRSFLDAHNPANPTGSPDPVPFSFFGGQDRQFLAEGLWEAVCGRRGRDLLTLGTSLMDRERTFNGDLRAVPGPGLLGVRSGERPTFVTTWSEFSRQVNPRLDYTAGLYLGQRSNGPGFLRPKLVSHYAAGNKDRFAALIYPLFFSQNGDLVPVETWAQPWDVDRLLQTDDSVLTSYELAWQHTAAQGTLFSATGFYRRGQDLAVPIVDPLTSPVLNRLPFGQGEIYGAEAVMERPLTEGLSLRLFSRIQGTNSLVSSGSLPYFPNWTSGARLDYLDRRGIRAFLALSHVGSREHRDFPDGPERQLGSYLTVDLRVSWQQDLHRNYFLQVNDLFDRSPDFYRNYHTAGRTLFGGVEFRF
jgi:tetratricopeptide (TPR) repeat protein